jgi:allantoate deiminase
MSLEPGAANVIPGHTVLTLDVRSGNDAARARFVETFKSGCRDIADRRHLGLSIKPTREVPTTPCDPELQQLLSIAVTDIGGEPLRLGSGAGHDGQAMAKLCPIGMLFVRCRGGVSHNPMEYVSPRDMGLAVAALIALIEKFDPKAMASQ